MRLLDLFCGAGGAGMGYHRAGFEVVGVDLEPQPHYPFEFHQADALTFPLDGFDVVHASPPCQAYTSMSQGRAPQRRAEHPALIATIRERLRVTGLPYVIENVSGARSELVEAFMLCGSSFGLPIWRHRLFETRPLLIGQPQCRHDLSGNAMGIYGKLDGRRLWTRRDGSELRNPASLEEAQEAMGMDWADWHGTKEAIPPAYTEWIGRRIMSATVRESPRSRAIDSTGAVSMEVPTHGR